MLVTPFELATFFLPTHPAFPTSPDSLDPVSSFPQEVAIMSTLESEEVGSEITLLPGMWYQATKGGMRRVWGSQRASLSELPSKPRARSRFTHVAHPLNTLLYQSNTGFFDSMSTEKLRLSC